MYKEFEYELELKKIEENNFPELILTILHNEYNIRAKLIKKNIIFFNNKYYHIMYNSKYSENTVNIKSSFYINIKKIHGKYHIINLFKNRNDIFQKLKRFILIHGRMPCKKENGVLFNYIKEYVLGYRSGNLSKKKIEAFKNIKEWEWNYEHLTEEGVKRENIINLLLDNQKLTTKEYKIYTLMIEQYKKKLLNQYFVRRLLLYKNIKNE